MGKMKELYIQKQEEDEIFMIDDMIDDEYFYDKQEK
jgi:hypothetical protein